MLTLKTLFLCGFLCSSCWLTAQSKDSSWRIQAQLLELPSYTCGFGCGELAQAGVYAFNILEGLPDSLQHQPVYLVIPCATCLNTKTVYTFQVSLYNKNRGYLVWSNYAYPSSGLVFWGEQYHPKKRRGRNRKKRKVCFNRRGKEYWSLDFFW